MSQDSFSKILKPNTSIWRYADLFVPRVREEYWLNAGGTFTPLENGIDIGDESPGKNIYLKHEYRNPTGSHKDRSLAYRIALARQKNETKLVISSSGNSAISAAHYCYQAGIALVALVSPETDPGKLRVLDEIAAADPHIHIVLSKRAMRLANYIAKKYKIPNLRPSLDDNSIEGFKSIGFELYEQLGGIQGNKVQLDNIFTFVTSASSLLGIGEAMKTLVDLGCLSQMPRLHAVQSGKAISIASGFSDKQADKVPNLGISHTRRTNAAIELLTRSKGNGWIMDSEQIKSAQELLAQAGIKTSWEGCASFAAVGEAMKNQQISNSETTICLLTGRYYADKKYDITHLPRVESFAATAEFLQQIQFC